jgi:excisionase family DNA binding protein
VWRFWGHIRGHPRGHFDLNIPLMTATSNPSTLVFPDRGATSERGDPAPVGSAFHPRPEPDRVDRLTLSVTEAAEMIGISRALAYDLVARGELPSVRLGHRVVVPKASLLAMFGASADTASV